MMEKIYPYRWWGAALVLALALALAPSIPRALEMDNSLTTWFIEGDPALASYERFQENFGNDELLVLVLESESGFLRAEALDQLRSFSDSLLRHPGVEQVLGLPSARVATGGGLGRGSRPLLPAENPNPDQLRRDLADLALLSEQFISADEKSLKLIIKMSALPDYDQERGRILQEIFALTNHYYAPEASFFGGLGVIYEALNELSRRDFAQFLGLGYLLMFVLLYLIYRRWQYVGLALLTIALSVYFTLAIYGFFGFRLNLMTTLVPAVVILLCVMDVMHILNEREKEGKASDALGSLNRVWRPCLFTSLTTMAGFLALLASPVAIVRQFGLFAALGIALGLFFSFGLSLFILVPLRHRAGGQKTSRYLSTWLVALERRRRWAWLFSALVLALSLAGLPRIVIDTQTASYLPPEHPSLQDSRAIEARFGPYMPLEFLVSPQGERDMRDPEILAALSTLGQEVERWPSIGSHLGYHSLFEAPLRERYGENWEQGWQKRQRIAAIAENAEALYPEWTRQLASPDYHLGRFSIFGELVSAGELAQVIQRIERRGEELLGERADIEVSGYQSLYAVIANYITESLVRSFAWATLLIFFLLWYFLADFKLAVLSLLPNFFPVLFMLGFMGWMNIALDTASATIASIVLSFSIDDTMHFAWHYRGKRREGKEAALARRATLAHVGRAIVLSSLVLFCGYTLMLLGSLKTVIYFGLLTAVAIAAALYSQLVLFPLLLRRFDR